MAINKLHNYNVASIGGKTAPQITTNKLHNYSSSSIGDQTAPQVTTNKLPDYSTDIKTSPISVVNSDNSGASINGMNATYKKPQASIGDQTAPQITPYKAPNIIETTKDMYKSGYELIEPINNKFKEILNSPQVAPVIQELSKRSSGTGIVSAIQAIGPKTFTEAYEANRAAQAGDPSKMNQFLYQLGDTLPQTALGVALNFVPFAGIPLSIAYWTALSASEQLDSKGEVTSSTNIGIDVVLDRMLGKSIESLFKAPAKTLKATLLQNFSVEGGTEVAQDLLKYGNNYRIAKTPEERQAVLEEAKEYFRSGQIAMTLGVGGLTGAGIGGGAYAINKMQNMTPAQKAEVKNTINKGITDQKGSVQIPLFGTTKGIQQTEEPTEFTGAQIKKEAEELGSDQGGLSDFTLDEIEKENYKVENIEISELRKLDEDLDDYLKNETNVREFEGEPFGMDPIVSSSGEVLDGYNRINQAIQNGETTISVLRGIEEKKSATKTKVETETEPRTEKENQIIKQLGEPTQGEPNCVREFRKILKEYPNAKPIRGIFGDSIEDVLFIYDHNKKSNLFSKIGGFTHIRADVDGKIMEGDFDNQPIFGKFYTEEEILKASEQSKSEPLFSGSQPETKTVPKEKVLPDGMVIPAQESVKPIFNAEQENKMSDEELQALISSAPKEGDVPLNGVEQEAAKEITRIIEEDIAVSAKEKVGMLDYIRTPWRVFDKMGIRPAFESLIDGYENYNQDLKENITRIRNWTRQINGESEQRVFDYLDGKKVELNAQELKVATEIKAWFNDWANKLNIDPKERISNYITHIFDPKTGEDIPVEISRLMLNKPATTVFNPYLIERLNKEGYKKELWTALDAYAKRATRKVNMDPALKDIAEASAKLRDKTQIQFLNSYLQKVNLQPSSLDVALDNDIKRVFGNTFGARPTANITRFSRRMLARAKIGGSITSFAKNLTQGVNTFGELGAKYTVEGYRDLVMFGGTELEDNGILISPLLDDTPYNAVIKPIEKLDTILFMNMNASELVNRGAAYYGAKRKFLDGKITGKEYQAAFGRRPTSGNGIDTYTPTIEEAVKYGKFVAAKTQFLFGPLHTPVALNSDIAKTLLQFQTFGVKQTEFVSGMVLDKDWKKFIRYFISSSLLFGTIGKLFGMAWDESFKTLNRIKSPMFSFIESLYQTLITKKDSYGNYLSNEKVFKKIEDIILTNVIPAGSQMKKTFQGISTVKEGKLLSPSGKFQTKVETTPLNYFRGATMGKYNLSESQDYYDARDAKSKASAKAKSSIFSGSKKSSGSKLHTY